ncbi:MAG: ATP-binding protein, partial [Chthoniobacteraceae bacterium]
VAIVLFHESDNPQVAACRGLSAAYQSRMDGHALWDRETVNANAITIDDIAKDESVRSMREDLKTEGIQALAVIPLIFRNESIGDLMIYHDDRHVFDPAEIRLGQTMAHQLASAVERIRGEDALRAEKMNAERASRAKDDFLATLSHELRTPLTPVLLTASNLAQDTGLPDEVRRDAQTIVRNVTLEARLIDDLLDLTRISKGKLSLRNELCDVHAALGFALDTVRDDAEQKDITIDLKLEAEHFQVAGDSARLQQIFWNVLGNAVKYTRANGHIRIRSSTEPNSTEPRVRIEINDDGHGFNSEMAERIFEPFEQEPNSIAQSTSGLGLGLAIARMLVRAHRGEIHAASDGDGEGATFTIELPTTERVPGERAHTRERHEQPVPAENEIALRLLLVEDHQSTSDVLRRLLTKRGHEVVLATSVSEARAAAAASPFDVVVSDLGLPDGTGFELMEELRAQYGLLGIAVSGFGMEEDVQRSHAVGYVAHLTKPIDVEELCAALARIAARRAPVER